jgi:hypothetical protein
MINDQALGTEDMKIVRYRIIFTKRDFGTTLLEREVMVNYATDPMSLGGRYMSDFWAGAALGEERDARDRLIKADYDDVRDAGDPEQNIASETLRRKPPEKWTIREEDKKYIAFGAELLDQLPRQKPEYDRDQVEVLRDIRDAIKEL